MFKPDVDTATKFKNIYIRILRSRASLCLFIAFLCVLAILTSWTPITTYSSYAKHLEKSFTLNTSNFYLVPSLSSTQLTVDMIDGFTEECNFSVSNYEGSDFTTSDIDYTITSEKDIENPLFTLYRKDSLENKIECPDNTISGTLGGGQNNTNTDTLYFKLNALDTPEGIYPVSINLVSSEPYIQSQSFIVNIQVVTNDMVIIEGTDIERPNVEIPEGEIMVFKDNQYVYLTPKDLVSGAVVSDEILEGGSLYIPESVGELAVGSNQTIDWDVQGNIVIEPDIEINNNNISVTMLSREGDVIMNGITMTGGSANPYVVDITAENGSIEANGTEITSKADGSGKINLVAQNDINISEAILESAGDQGINIQSTAGDINAGGADIESTNGATTAVIKLESAGSINLDQATVISIVELTISGVEGISAQSANIKATGQGSNAFVKLESAGLINLDQATVSSNVALTISGVEGISAQSANITNSAYGKDINITSSNGAIVLSSLTDASQMLVSSSGGSIYITAQEDIFIIAANIKASTSWGMELKFEATGSGRTLWVQDAIVQGNSINAYNLTVEGTPANGTINP